MGGPKSFVQSFDDCFSFWVISQTNYINYINNITRTAAGEVRANETPFRVAQLIS